MWQRAAPQNQRAFGGHCGRNCRLDGSEKWQTHVLNIKQQRKPLMRQHPAWQRSSFLPKDGDGFNNCAAARAARWQKGEQAAWTRLWTCCLHRCCCHGFPVGLLHRSGSAPVKEAFRCHQRRSVSGEARVLTPDCACCNVSAQTTRLFSHTCKFSSPVLHQLFLPPFLLNPDLKGRSGRFGWEVVYSPSSLVRKWTLVNAC